MSKRKLTTKDFYIHTYVSWEELENVFGAKEYKKFMQWMNGQTGALEGVWPWDLERYLQGLPVVD